MTIWIQTTNSTHFKPQASLPVAN